MAGVAASIWPASCWRCTVPPELVNAAWEVTVIFCLILAAAIARMGE